MKVKDLTVSQLIEIIRNNPDAITGEFGTMYINSYKDGSIYLDGDIDLEAEVDVGVKSPTDDK